ncbi:carboxypeptidase Q-like [Pollicipes pollicipes]|uniref:carboxypeptidase Q-like n=1 Tax=Pollicipes pollicipes TaxID=41117 RepID=UPI0018853199|nr:carboxypeptidase Q-like [Pollicipes pollicipes]
MTRWSHSLPLLAALVAASQLTRASAQTSCALPDSVKNNILQYQDDVDKIMQAALNEQQHRHAAYDGLDDFVERFGARPSGSDELEDAIDFMEQTARQDGFRVRTEEVMVPHWVRGEETLLMLRPRRKSMSILGLGTTIGTQQYPAGVLKAEAVVFNSFEEMEKAGKAKVSGKIVVFNAPFGDTKDLPIDRYRESNEYRVHGAARASKLGALAALVRSRTDFSLNTPHTGSMDYNVSTPIPAAAVTPEDANIMARHFKKGKPVELLLKMSAANLPQRKSRNLIVDYGPADAIEMVLLSAHMDSWDVGEGAMDNGGGVFVNYHSIKLLKQLGLMPRRTIRVVFWTAEEEGYYGGKEYIKNHEFDVQKMQIAIENDLGVSRPLGLRIAGSDAAKCFVKHTTSLFGLANSTRTAGDPPLSEAHLFNEKGVPAACIDTDQSRYFWYHHTQADTMDALDPREMDLCVATMASAAFVFADVPDRVPSDVAVPLRSVKGSANKRSSAIARRPALCLVAVVAVAARLLG